MLARKPSTILIVEDDPGIAELERQCLEESGHVTHHASTAEEALDLIGRIHVDLILLDYRLPGGVDGLDFYSRVKTSGSNVPVILVTGFSNEATVIQALRMGVRDFVTKSVEYLEYLPEAVQRVLRQVHTEHQLAESEARLASIIATATDAIVVTDHSHRITLFNAAAERMFRCASGDAIHSSVFRFIPPENPSSENSGPNPNAYPQSQQSSRGIRADGSEFPLDATFSRHEVAGSTCYTIVARDITERKMLESQLLHAQRMEAIGVLAGGIAHDFNNLLTVINGYSDMLLGGFPLDAAVRELISQIHRAGDQAAALTRQLLAFSRKQVLSPKILDLNALIRELDKMLRRLIGADINLAHSLAEDLGAIRADPAQVEQVIMNLSINARDAMPRGGHLTLETRNVDFDDSYAQHHFQIRPGPYVLLAVSDTGIGMDENIRARIFEPFFTTKEPGKGTGLGLSTVHGIVQQSGGRIEVYSEPGKGTTFKVYFPRLVNRGALGSTTATELQIPRGSETILLVDDDEGVRALAKLVLQSCGYTVLESAHGLEGLQVGLSRKAPIDLLITDVVMPQMSGRTLVEQLRSFHPEMKILYISGYTDDAIVRHGVLESDVAFLHKPFTPMSLAQKVRAVIDGTPRH